MKWEQLFNRSKSPLWLEAGATKFGKEYPLLVFKALSRSQLHSAEVLYRSIPIDGNGFSAFRVLADHFPFFHVAPMAADWRFFQEVVKMQVVGRCSFKTAFAVRASEEKLSFSHSPTSLTNSLI
jgi:hypothetical protein